MSALPAMEAPRQPLAERILDAFPSGAYAFSALLRLMDIVESDAVQTAAVECRLQPRLLVNPGFVARHAASAEKLMMLVMHELHHVLLGHTTLFPRLTPVQNFVFDAVINGIVCRMFPEREHVAFFTDFYSAAEFPECLLRPMPGWPGRPRTAPGIASLPAEMRRVAEEVHRALYSTAGATYQEVYEVLPKLLGVQAVAGIPLLGAHGEDGEDGGLEARSPLLFDVVRSIVEQWPQPPDPIRGRSLADVLKQERTRPRKTPSARGVLRGLIRRIADARLDGAVRRRALAGCEALTPIPSASRRGLVQRALGFEPLLHPGSVPWRRTVRAGERVHVYVDVSGSMSGVKDALYGAILDCLPLLHPAVHLFSTRVADVSFAELRQGVCRTTGGTSIACVAEHMAAQNVRRALIVTDGWVGAPRGGHRDTLARARLAVAFFGNHNSADLAGVADHTGVITIGGKP